MNLVFDFGAVLFTWQPKELLRQHFPAVASGDERALALVKDFFHHPDWLAFDRGDLLMHAVVSRTAKRLALSLPEVSRLVANVAELLAPMPQSVALLEQLRRQRQAGVDIRLYFLFNMPEPYARELEQRHAFLQCFDGGIFSGDVKRVKPEPEIYQMLEQRYALDPARTVFIDDMQPNVVAAQSRGWRGVRFESTQQLQADLTRLISLQ